MLRSVLIATWGVCLGSLWLKAQTPIQYRDSLPLDTTVKNLSFQVHVPMGQTFLRVSPRPGMSYVRAVMPDRQLEPVFQVSRQASLCTGVLGWMNADASNREIREVREGKANIQASYSNTAVHVSGDPAAYLMELDAPAGYPIDLDFNLGYGSSRLDMTALSIRNLHVVSASADLVLTWNAANATSMDKLFVDGGMSRIVLRNLEFSRARQMKIINGMGDTRIIIGNRQPIASSLDIEAGAGKCELLLGEEVPCKIVFADNVLSTIEMPEGFVQTDTQTWVNLPYKSSPDNALNVYVDVGIGTFVLTSFR